jgi:hypothetical protein
MRCSYNISGFQRLDPTELSGTCSERHQFGGLNKRDMSPSVQTAA